MIAGVGTDIIEIDRVAGLMERDEDGFLGRWFTSGERAYCASRSHPAAHFAARLAAKEAVAKAVRWQWDGPVPWRDIEVYHLDDGAPAVRLTGRLAADAETAGVREIQISLSHSRCHATAIAVALR